MANEQASGGKPAPWLIAAWPGMGNVAVIAAGYLVTELGMKPAGELPSRDHFDVDEVEVKGGVITPPHLPRGIFFRWNNPGPNRDLIVFLGEAQPATGAYAYANELLDMAQRLGVSRVVTFASIASGLHPAEDPKVSGVATSREMMEELKRTEVSPMEDGQIGGLNGVLLGAAAHRGMPGFALLAEIPFFAAAVPNPKAAKAALSVFSVLAGGDVSLNELSKQATAIDRLLIEAMRKIEQEEEDEEEDEEEGPSIAGIGDAGGTGGASSREPDPPRLDYRTRRRIEQLFHEARSDRRKAVELKEELDRLGIYWQYEDRFLDLFRRAE